LSRISKGWSLRNTLETEPGISLDIILDHGMEVANFTFIAYYQYQTLSTTPIEGARVIICMWDKSDGPSNIMEDSGIP